VAGGVDEIPARRRVSVEDGEGLLFVGGEGQPKIGAPVVEGALVTADVVGPAFFKAIKGPLPQVRVMPTGGVDLTTAATFLKAGACCLGVGSQLVEPAAIAARIV